MKWLIKGLILPLFPAVVLADVILWNATHGFGHKVNIQSSAREVWETWKKW